MLLVYLFFSHSFGANPLSDVPPISVSIDQMKITGNCQVPSDYKQCSNTLTNEPCGKTCWYNPTRPEHKDDPPTFEYTFKGEQYQIYGKNHANHGNFALYLDDVFVENVTQKISDDELPYDLQYTSPLLPYGTHTIKVKSVGEDLEIWKFTYWPSVHAQRLNSTEILPLWNVESDKIGGLREWAHENSYAAVKKRRTVKFSKIWVYGSTDKGHGDMLFMINGEEHYINQNTTTRVDGALVYESENLPLNDYTITFSQHIEDCVLYCIYYLQDQPPPTPPPISVSIDQMKITGKCQVPPDYKRCPNTLTNEPCGKTCWYNPTRPEHKDDPPTFEYTFRGEKYQIYGKNHANHGNFALYLDDVFVENVTQKISDDELPYDLQYTSPLLPYGTHTIKVKSVGEDLEIWKFTYWPSVHAQRLNSTEILPLWNVESDKIGGLREWAHENSYAAVNKTYMLKFSKIWVYGSTDNTHGDMMFSINNDYHYINQNTSSRVDGVLLYESDYLPLKDYNITFSQHVEDCVFYCIYYLPVETTVPISVGVGQMTITGATGEEKTECSNTEVAKTPCGITKWFNPENAAHTANPPTFSYTFKGEKFQVYGKYDPDHGNYKLFLDGQLIKTINQYGTYDVPFALQYTSDILPYGEHTIRVETDKAQFALYKFAYWPSVRAKRLNSTEFYRSWNVESDGIGGLREWAHENNKNGVKKVSTFQFSKIWVYGSTDIKHGDMFMGINGEDHYINQNTTNRVDGALVYESDYLPLADYTLTFQQHFEDCVLYCVYYLPYSFPIPPPISVRIDQMKITGSYGTSEDVICTNRVEDSPCGKTAWYNPVSHSGNKPKFEYTFKGEMFQVFGKYDPDHGNYSLYLDNVLIKEIDQYGPVDVPYALQYTSNLLPYGEHTIRIEMKDKQFELYKFAYWPMVQAQRLNSTQILPLWNVESDKIGGLREWAHENSYAGVKKTTKARFSKIWIYGSTDNTHGDMTFTINGEEHTINQNSNSRVDGALLYESDYLPLDDYNITFSQHVEDCVLYCIYYLPYPQPTPPPISVGIRQMTITGQEGRSTFRECSNSEVATLPCGSSSWFNPANPGHSSNPPTYSYTFKGEKFQVYGKYDPDHGNYKLSLDGKFVKTIDQYGTYDVPYVLQYTSDILPYGEHTIKIEMAGAQFEIYKFAYWPSVHAERLNSTQILPLWNVESDKVGGLREWAHENSYAGVNKTTVVEFSKIWVYGSTDYTHGDMAFTIDEEEHFLDQNTTNRVDGVLLYESEYLPLKEYTLTFSQHIEDCVLYCVYYIPLPSPSPMPTMTPPPTSTPTATPEATPEDYIIDDNRIDICDFTNKKQCNVTNQELDKHILVKVLVANFTGYKDDDEGGAIHIINGGIRCNNSVFNSCESKKAGGAIYIHNSFDYSYVLDLENLNFNECSADYGGAVYMHSRSLKSVANVKYCRFNANKALAQKGNGNNYGGSAIYLMILEGNFESNTFTNNKGVGGALKIINNFPEQNLFKKLLGVYGSIIISDCSFEIEKDSDCSLFYLRGNNGVSVELNNCQFTGLLSHGSHYIDGEVITPNSPQLVVKSCKFASDFKNSVNYEGKDGFVSIDIKSQVFEGGNNSIDDNKNDKVENKKWKILTTLVLPAVGFAAIVVFVIAFLVMKKINHEETTELPQEIRESLL
ncbi:hypothetical protein M9Y10_035879 [Tritrichomonas musculus]|uniref:PA14 domain-containing protein n=1 Tax=Tritrichomonas musculus TaxID=1915356 RepID=A0ABR2GVI2_9EUKA